MPIQMKESRTAPGYWVVAVDCDVVAASDIAGPRSQWGVWQAHWQEGREKPSKKPYNGNTRPISTDDPESWRTFAEARKLYELGGFDGVGVLMSSLVGFIGIDLDDCLNDDGHARQESAEIVRAFIQLGGYIERSPGGRGLRQFVKGKLPAGYKEKATWGEIYDYRSTRYLTMTGAVWPDWKQQAGDVIENQKGIDGFMSRFGKKAAAPKVVRDDDPDFPAVNRSAVEVLKLLKQHNLQGKLTRLLAGDIGDYDGQSEADAGLCFHAAYFTRDPAVIEAVMRSSGLVRKKWDDMRGSQTWLQMTIAVELEHQQRNFDEDRAEKRQQAEAAKADKSKFKQLAADALIGDVGDLLTPKGAIKANAWVLSELLVRDRRLVGTLHFDEFSGYAICNRPLREALDDKSAPERIGRIDDDHVRAFSRWFGRTWGLDLRVDQVGAAVIACAEAVRINPVIDRLEAFERLWDRKARIDGWLVSYCNCQTKCGGGKDISDYVESVGSRFLISAVARAFKPGSKVDTMLVLEGRQGARKSSAVRLLTETVGADYFREGFHLGGGKDDLIALRGRLVVEWGELSGMGKRDRNELKTFLSQQTDSYRQPYGGLEKDWPRTAVFVGTTNDDGYLADPTGGRRFWPVTVGRAELDRLRRDAPMLWAEAVHRYKAGEKWWFDDDDPRDQRLSAMAQGEQQRRVGGTYWSEVAADLAEKLVCGHLLYLSKAKELTTAQPWERFNRTQMTVWLSRVALASGNVASVTGYDDDTGQGQGGEGVRSQATTIDDRNWLKVAEGLRLAGWESKKSNGLMLWALTPEKRESLCLQHGRDIGPKISPMKRAFRERQGQRTATKTAGNDNGIPQYEMTSGVGESVG